MGLFSKIKNFITGGAAEVSILFEEIETDGSKPIRLFVSALAKDDCTIKEVYLDIRERETYKKRVQQSTTDSEGNSSTLYEDQTRYEDHYTKQIILASDVKLKSGEEKKWLAEFELPHDALSTYHGQEVFLKWEMQAGLDMPGNDPDSGWQAFIVKKNMNYSLIHVIS